MATSVSQKRHTHWEREAGKREGKKERNEGRKKERKKRKKEWERERESRTVYRGSVLRPPVWSRA